jgi:hypothetical protein
MEGEMAHGGVRREPDTSKGEKTQASGKFGWMFPKLPGLPASDQALAELGAAMLDSSPASTEGDNPNVQAGFTYLGQFIDHDITLDTTTPSEVLNDPGSVRNFRTPLLELDCLYGQGPVAQPYLYERAEHPAKFVLGTMTKGIGDPTIPIDLQNDLQRTDAGFALIGDPRNDENLIVAQLHVAFLKFHNKVVDLRIAAGVPSSAVFEDARRVVTWHYQWLVLHDFLAKLVDVNVLHSVLKDGPRHYKPKGPDAYMPMEFSVAAYRLGHSMVRQVYNYNRVFRPGGVAAGTLELLFRFTGLSGTDVPVPSDWIIDWRRFFDFGPQAPRGGFGLNLSRTLDPYIAAELHKLPFGGGDLAVRNLLRGRNRLLPSGQAVAGVLGVPALTPAELATGPEAEVVKKHGFDKQAPLWYYILKEASVQHGGAHLGQVGSHLLCEVFVGLLKFDPNSFLAKQPGWKPTLEDVAIPGQFTMVDLLRLADVVNPIGEEKFGD